MKQASAAIIIGLAFLLGLAFSAAVDQWLGSSAPQATFLIPESGK
jgi:hypothetical protein